MGTPISRERLVADRFRRIWAIVMEISEAPGKSRRDLADKFHLSERQVQSDLNIVRRDMRLPLVRRYGYRFEGEAGGTVPTLEEAQLLVVLVRSSMRDHGINKGLLRSLVLKLPAMFPPHLQPVVQQMLDAFAAPKAGSRGQVFGAVCDALLRQTAVELTYDSHDMSVPFTQVVVWPELVIPYDRRWFVIGRIRERRPHQMLWIDNAVSATPVDKKRDAA